MENYDSMEDALFAALEAVKAVDNNSMEWTSLVYRTPDGRIQYSTPLGGKTEGKFREGIKIPKGSQLLSLAHNHPPQRGGREERFSDEDIAQAQKLKIPTAIAYGPGVDSSIFTPGQSVVEKQPFGPTYSLGSPFNYVPEVKVTAQKIGSPEQEALISALRKEVP